MLLFVFQPVLTLPKWISDYKMTSKPTMLNAGLDDQVPVLLILI